MNNLRDADHFLLGLPMLACMTGGAVAGFLQQTSIEPLKAVGWLGKHTAIILGVASGVPLMVYSFAKLTFAKILNTVTWNHFECLKSFKEHAEWQFNVTLIAVSALPLIVIALPHLIPAAYKSYKTYKECQKIIDELTKSDLYKTLTSLYTQSKQFFSSKIPYAEKQDVIVEVSSVEEIEIEEVEVMN